MDMILNILRRDPGAEESYWQRFRVETQTDNDTVASALTALNAREDLRDAEGRSARSIQWESSCLQKKCGACAMVINGRPRLACEACLAEFPGGTVTVEPLRKFPVVCDLMVDRSILFENLKTLGLWLREDSDLPEEMHDLAYEGSECIQCGCCLEICPNFYAGGEFFGMSTVPVTMRMLSEMSRSGAREIASEYSKHTFAGCGKSLACKDICPKGIDTERLLVNANAIAVWKRKKKAR